MVASPSRTQRYDHRRASNTTSSPRCARITTRLAVPPIAAPEPSRDQYKTSDLSDLRHGGGGGVAPDAQTVIVLSQTPGRRG